MLQNGKSYFLISKLIKFLILNSVNIKDEDMILVNRLSIFVLDYFFVSKISSYNILRMLAGV